MFCQMQVKLENNIFYYSVKKSFIIFLNEAFSEAFYFTFNSFFLLHVNIITPSVHLLTHTYHFLRVNVNNCIDGVIILTWCNNIDMSY